MNVAVQKLYKIKGTNIHRKLWRIRCSTIALDEFFFKKDKSGPWRKTWMRTTRNSYTR